MSDSEPVQPIQYAGGKQRQVTALLDVLPSDAEMYVEPFGGAASVLLHRDPCPVEVYNDVDGYVVDFFRAARDHDDALISAIEATPYARSEFVDAIENPGEGDVVERARRLYVRVLMSVGSRPAPRVLSPGRWARVTRPDAVGGAPKPVAAFREDVEAGVRFVAERFRDVLIENRDVVRVLEEYDHPDAVVYCDPPYVPGSCGENREYVEGMSRDDHREFLDVLTGVDARVAVSAFQSDLYDARLVDRAGWDRVDLDAQRLSPGSNGSTAGDEVVYLNYADGSDVGSTGSVAQRSLASFDRGGDSG